MSEHTKKQNIDNINISTLFLREDGHVFKIPSNLFDSKFTKYEIKNTTQVEQIRNKIRWEIAENPGKLFADLNAKYSKLGSLVKGIRYRENLSQNEFAKRIGIAQADLSKIENGKRPIGTIVSNRIIKEFKLNRTLLK